MKDERRIRRHDRHNTKRKAASDSRANAYVRVFAERMLIDEWTGVLLINADYEIVDVNPMLCSLFGGARADLLGMPVDEWSRRLEVPLPIERSLLEGKSFRNRKFAWHSGERMREFMVDGDLLQDGSASIGAYLLFRDVSQETLLEEQVRRSDRLKMIGQIAAGTAHEIRNPLTAIKGFVQLMQKSFHERQMAKEQEYVSIVLSELDRVHGLVNEFLLLGKTKETKLMPIRIGRILQEMMPMLRTEAMLHDISLRYEPRGGGELPLILADKEMLKQVFLNLGKNAIEAMGKGGILIIRERGGELYSGLVSVDICDSGPGISQELLSRIFDPFFTTKEQGTGLGLSICQRILHDMGGFLDVVSSSAGTIFTVSVPYAVPIGAGLASGGGALSLDDV